MKKGSVVASARVNDRAGLLDRPGGGEFGQQDAVDLLDGLRSALQPPPAGHPRAETQLLGWVLPADTGVRARTGCCQQLTVWTAWREPRALSGPLWAGAMWEAWRSTAGVIPPFKLAAGLAVLISLPSAPFHEWGRNSQLGRQMGLGDVAVGVSRDDLERLRASKAYWRGVWGLRLLVLGPILLLLTALLVAAGLRGAGLVFPLVLAFGVPCVGMGLVWSAVLPMLRLQGEVFRDQGLTSVRIRRSVVAPFMIIRDVLGLNG